MKFLMSFKLRYMAGSLLVFFAIFSTTSVVSALTANTTITSTVSKVISLLTTSGSVNLDVVPTGAGAQTIASDTVTVSTNDVSGYTLTLSSSTASLPLTSGANTIPASTGTRATPSLQSANTWGYCVPTVATMTSLCPSGNASSAAISGTYKFAGIKASGSGDTIANTNTTASNATTTVWYGVAANTSQPSGTYTNTVTYTATIN